MKNEFELIDWIRSEAPAPSKGLGIGDDAAVIAFDGGGNLVVTTDAIVEDVDFIRKKMPAALAGRKALAINLSDLAAMGARPDSFVLTLGIPRDLKTEWIKDFCRGVFSLARKHKAACVGGDISRSRVFFASITLLGRVKKGREVKRSGAKAGDVIYVTGSLGGSLLGRHASFEPRVQEGLFLAGTVRPTAMMDVSDGLAQDLGHLLKASSVRAVLELDRIPVSSEARKMAKGCAEEALVSALSDGEDFELLFTVRKTAVKKLEASWKKLFPRTRLTRIGAVEKGKPSIVWVRGGKKETSFRLAQKGYQHF